MARCQNAQKQNIIKTYYYGKCSKISNTLNYEHLKLSPKIIFKTSQKIEHCPFSGKCISKITNTHYFRRKIDVRLSVCPISVRYTSTVQHVSGRDIWNVPFYLDG